MPALIVLIEPSQYLVSNACQISGDRIVRHLIVQIDSINFALDWELKGQQPGGKTFKTNFAKMTYETRTGCQPPSKTASKQDRQQFKLFKSRQQTIICARNYLMELYKQVCCPFYEVYLTLFADSFVSSVFMSFWTQYGTLTIL